MISTMLLLSGITTILHTYFGTRLPLVQGSSFVYLAPALAIINAREFRNLTEHVSANDESILLPDIVLSSSPKITARIFYKPKVYAPTTITTTAFV